MHPPSLQGFLHWLRRSGAEVKREAEGAGSLVRVMTVHGAKGLAGAAGHPAGHHVAAAGRGVDPVGDRSGHRARRADLVAAAGAALRRRPASARRGEAAADGGAQPAALRRADPRRGPAGGLRLADAARAGRRMLVSAGRARLRRAAGGARGVRRLGRRAAAPRHAAARRSPIAGPAGESSRLRSSLPRWAGTAPDWRAAPPPAEPGRPERLAPSRPENVELGPVPAAASPLAAREAANNRFRRGTLIHALLQHLPDLPPAQRAAAALRLAGPARQRPARRRGRDAGRARCWRSSTIPNWRRCSGRTAGPRCR